jgi:hypothetical protein
MREGKSLGIAISGVLLLFFRLAMRSVGLILHNGARKRSVHHRVWNIGNARPLRIKYILMLGVAGGGRSDAGITEDPGGHVRNPASCISVFPQCGGSGFVIGINGQSTLSFTS